MENHTSTCRFILAANYSSKILDPIQSRCAIFRFKPLANEHVMELINNITKSEKLQATTEAKEALIKVAEGDCRRATNILQSCAATEKAITPETVYSLASVAEPTEIKEVLTMALKGDFIKSREKLLDVMLRYGLSGLDTIKQIQSGIWNLEIDGRKKVMLIDKCGEIEFRLVEGADEFVQLEALLAQFVLAGA